MFHESGLLDLSSRQTLLREWMTAQFVPLFSLDEGTAAFTDDHAIEPEKRVFLQSTAAARARRHPRASPMDCVLRRSLGDLKREIEPERDAAALARHAAADRAERKIADALHEPQTDRDVSEALHRTTRSPRRAWSSPC